MLALAAAVLASAASGLVGTQSGNSLRITYWKDGLRQDESATWTLRCNPPRGSLARPGVACRRLAAGGTKLFAPLPKDIACTEIYGGPQRARIVGNVAGKRIWAMFQRTNGCEIDRWNRISPWLLPPGGVTSWWTRP